MDGLFTFLNFTVLLQRYLNIDNTGIVLDNIGNVFGNLWYGDWKQTSKKKLADTQVFTFVLV